MKRWRYYDGVLGEERYADCIALVGDRQCKMPKQFDNVCTRHFRQIKAGKPVQIPEGFYEPHDTVKATGSYVDPEGEWDLCRHCGLRPKVWTFDNGAYTACGCWYDTYHHFRIVAESIGSVVNRTKGFKDHDDDALRLHWNQWCESGEVFELEEGQW